MNDNDQDIARAEIINSALDIVNQEVEKNKILYASKMKDLMEPNKPFIKSTQNMSDRKYDLASKKWILGTLKSIVILIIIIIIILININNKQK